MTNAFDTIARQIEEIENKLSNLFRDAQADEVLPVRWSFCAGVLCWHVQLVEEVLEQDIDIEITSVALIIRARSALEPSKVLLGVLPVPGIFNHHHPEIQFKSDFLEIRLQWIGDNSY
jgi:hypothetical protein